MGRRACGAGGPHGPRESAFLLGPGPPEAFGQKAAGAEPALVGGQDLEESVLGAGQPYRLPPPGDQAGIKVDTDRADLDASRPVEPLGPAVLQRPADPGQQVGHGERLGDVVVGAQVECRGPAVLVVDGGENHDRHRRPGTESGKHLQTADVGKAQVEHDAVGLLGLDHRQGVLARGCGERLVATGAQVGDDDAQDRGLVVDHQDSVTHDRLAERGLIDRRPENRDDPAKDTRSRRRFLMASLRAPGS